jgi:hypothetical protein
MQQFWMGTTILEELAASVFTSGYPEDGGG